MERHVITCSERVKHIYPKNVYQLKETPFEKLDSFNIAYREDQKLFKNLAVFDFESICVKAETYKETETTKWIGKYVPISVSVSSNLIPEPIFLCSSDPRHFVSSFISTHEGWTTQSKSNYLRLFRPNILLVFLRILNKNAQARKLIFGRH